VADLLGEFLVVVAVIGGLEFLDRTSFALIGLAAQQPARPTWAGAATAFAVTTLLAVGIGTALLAALGGQIVYLRLGGGIFLLGYAGYLLLVPEADRRPPAGRSAFATAFLLIFLLEIGDTTMIFTILFVSTTQQPLLVALAAASALAGVAACAVLIGSRLGERVEPKVLERVVIVILIVAGLVTIVYSLEPGWFPSAFG
jgi:putative Ca2+/H+ antiporter (TMEM165/GDT1 family)